MDKDQFLIYKIFFLVIILSFAVTLEILNKNLFGDTGITITGMILILLGIFFVFYGVNGIFNRQIFWPRYGGYGFDVFKGVNAVGYGLLSITLGLFEVFLMLQGYQEFLLVHLITFLIAIFPLFFGIKSFREKRVFWPVIIKTEEDIVGLTGENAQKIGVLAVFFSSILLIIFFNVPHYLDLFFSNLF